MSLKLGLIVVDSMISPPYIADKWRARSVEYSLDGTALEDRLGGTKKVIKLPFGIISQSKWENLKALLSQKTISVIGYVEVVRSNNLSNGKYMELLISNY